MVIVRAYMHNRKHKSYNWILITVPEIQLSTKTPSSLPVWMLRLSGSPWFLSSHCSLIRMTKILQFEKCQLIQSYPADPNHGLVENSLLSMSICQKYASIGASPTSSKHHRNRCTAVAYHGKLSHWRGRGTGSNWTLNRIRPKPKVVSS